MQRPIRTDTIQPSRIATTANNGRALRLSQRHLEALAREIADPGPRLLSGFRPATETDYDALVAELMQRAPRDDFWVFAYGSLIWNPEYDVAEQRVARAHGWRRSFCLGWDYRFRGSDTEPGLMLALDRGGQCRGVVHRIPGDRLKENLDRLVRREMSMVPSAFPARFIRTETDEGPVTALTFAMNRNSGRYVSGLSDEALADVLARACGFRGSMAEYLFSTVSRLEELGIHDRYLWRLQELVAERIERAHFGSETTP
ncbi:gamma-glutamylcyclotransferase [Mesorhizobium sp. CAU 1732]|uniref:gamma-glutamylcyclotransferase n=1 Tax=Mesorhizobium sp. CAU 1732 TaxID=3140358 RepID=UPI0032619FEF